MFKSALLSTRRQPNPLNFKPVKRIVVVLVDGLGAQNVLDRSGHAPWLTAQINGGAVTTTGFPSTTSANIASFATGLTAGEHGIIGHQVFDRDYDERINLLTGWNERTDPSVWQPHQTVSELAVSLGTHCYVIGHEEYRHSGYTRATMREAIYQSAESIEERFDVARQNLHSPGESISYLYVPELDKFGHRFGWQSPGWATLLEDLDARLRDFAASLPKDSALVVTADHGMIDSAQENRLFIDDYVEEGGLLEWFGGDTRASYLYLKDPSATEAMIQNLARHSGIFSAISARDAVAANWFGPVEVEAEARLPEIVLLAKSSITLFHSVYSKKRSSEMIAHHGGLSAQELRIPLIRIGI